MSNISKKRREGSRAKIKSMGDHKEFLRRITKTLYYGQMPALPCLSLPLTEVSCEEWSAAQRGRSVRRLHGDSAARLARRASPAALVLALLYLERLRNARHRYLAHTPPADLFLVSLMVGNKFLQDDGEDDEVLCSEWAASGGMDLPHLNRLELDFLAAMDWNISVNEQSFEDGLQWLERRVALKQAQLRGFFTYTDLDATIDGALLAELLRSLTASCLAVALAYITSVLALVTSTLVMSHTCLPLLQHLATISSPALQTDLIAQTYPSYLPLPPYIPNSTINLLPVDNLLEEPELAMKCCTNWLQYQDNTKKTWFDSVVVYDWKSVEPWWSRTSIFNWLYQSSLVNPMQRWLEKMNEFAELFKQELDVEPLQSSDRCKDYDKLDKVNSGQQKCVRQWLNLSKLGALVVSVSDR